MVLTDPQIARLLGEKKPYLDPNDMLSDLKPDHTDAQRQVVRRFPSSDGFAFALRVRQNLSDPTDFSVILSYEAGGSSINLRRHNGASHQHRNPIEGTSLSATCHIHMATHRYQLRGSDAEHYAEPTDRFHDVAGALNRMLEDANFETPAQASLEGL